MSTTDKVNRYYFYLIENNYFTEKELQLVTDVAGYSMNTLDDCVYSRFGYESVEDFIGAR